MPAHRNLCVSTYACATTSRAHAVRLRGSCSLRPSSQRHRAPVPQPNHAHEDHSPTQPLPGCPPTPPHAPGPSRLESLSARRAHGLSEAHPGPDNFAVKPTMLLTGRMAKGSYRDSSLTSYGWSGSQKLPPGGDTRRRQDGGPGPGGEPEIPSKHPPRISALVRGVGQRRRAP